MSQSWKAEGNSRTRQDPDPEARPLSPDGCAILTDPKCKLGTNPSPSLGLDLPPDQGGTITLCPTLGLSPLDSLSPREAELLRGCGSIKDLA